MIEQSGSTVAQRFVLDRIAGHGGMGTVFRAYDVQGGTYVALKVLARKATLHDPAFRRFARETQILSELRHPGIVAYVAHGLTPAGDPYLAMEWLEGYDLAQCLKRQGLTLHETLALARRAAAALAVAHRRGIVHRDIKPSNLFLREGRPEQVVFLDFGIARDLLLESSLTVTGEAIGTPRYMAPEQANAQPDITPRSDIYSLGCVLFECLTGRPPIAGDHMAAVLAKILFQQVPPLSQVRPGIPRVLEDLLRRMLARNPAERPADAAVLYEELIALPSLPDLPAPDGGETQSTIPKGSSEQQLVSVILALPRSSVNARADELPTQDLHPQTLEKSHRDALRRALVVYGAQVELLIDGSAVATLVHNRASSAVDQAVLAARCALAMREQWPDAYVALVTGRGILNGQLPTGEAIDRAWQLLSSQKSATLESADGSGVQIFLDEITAGLLNTRFDLSRCNTSCFALGAERVTFDPARPLLGKPTPCIGRERELAMLDMVYSECRDDLSAHAVLITAAPGSGKSRLRHEFLRRLSTRGEEVEVLIGRGDPMSAGVSYGLLAQALHGMCGIQDGEPLVARRTKLRQRVAQVMPESAVQHTIEFLGELCNIPFSDEDSPQLAAARQDPQLMSNQCGLAFLDFLRAECSERMLILVLEDLHWGDILTVRLIDAVLRELHSNPLMVLALARPEVFEQFPNLWKERSVHTFQLAGLNKKSCERLISQVMGEKIPSEIVSRVIEQSAGNALYLEEIAWLASYSTAYPNLGLFQAPSVHQC